MKPQIQAFFDNCTHTISYIIYDEIGGYGAIIDPVLGYNYKSGKVNTKFADNLINAVNKLNLKIEWILETHIHADHLSAAQYLKKAFDAKIGIGKYIKQVQFIFKDILNLGDEFTTNGSQFDYLFEDEEYFSIGKLTAQALFVGGHTPADVAYKIDDAIFVGDTIFMPDVGTARCDFPEGNASNLYKSIQKILSFPENTRLFMCHDYPTNNREVKWQSSVQEQKAYNIHVNDNINQEQFVSMRTIKDSTLDMPTLIWQSIQVNIRAGNFPLAEDNQTIYLKIPVKF
jgi:glyoxylase-like metal-dependent hydrolase (beta-lactamase superfamily II)